MTFLKKVISGGQTGVDQAALRAAKACQLETGGWMPRDFRTHDGWRPEFKKLYGMTEDRSPDYAPRTKKNVMAAAATLVVGRADSPGCRLTIHCCQVYGKPVQTIFFVPPFERSGPVAQIKWWLEKNRPEILNVAGNREHKNPGIGEWTEAVLIQVFRGLTG